MWCCPALPQTPGRVKFKVAAVYWLQATWLVAITRWTSQFVIWNISPTCIMCFFIFVPLSYNFRGVLKASLVGSSSIVSQFQNWTYLSTARIYCITTALKYTSRQVGTHYQVDFFFKMKWLELYFVIWLGFCGY